MEFIPKDLGEAADASRGITKTSEKVKDVLSVVLVLGLLYLFLGFLAQVAANRVPDRWEAQLFQSPTNLDLEESESLNRAKEILTKLLQNQELRDLPYQVHYLPLPEPNAFAFPGGHIVLTKGLLEKVDSEIGLAMVISHELGHQQHRHALKGMGRSFLIRGTFGLLFGNDQMIASSMNLMESSHSRSQEKEADLFGLELVYDAYGTTEGSLLFFEMISGDQEGWSSLLESHPLPRERILYLRTEAKRLQGLSHD